MLILAKREKTWRVRGKHGKPGETSSASGIDLGYSLYSSVSQSVTLVPPVVLEVVSSGTHKTPGHLPSSNEIRKHEQ